MPELPDILAYIDALRPRVQGQTIRRIRVRSPFLVRSVDPPIDAAEGKTIRDVRRLGKRIVFALDDELSIVLHLMIAGRLRWSDKPNANLPGKIALAAFDFDAATLILTEASQKKRASLHLVRGEDALQAHNPAGIDVLACDATVFAAALRQENHTVKRSLTDPKLFDGIGNAYSDEILHAARLSPFKQTRSLSDDEIARLHAAARDTLQYWIAKLAEQLEARFPKPGEITAFRPGFAVHGRYGEPCPVCNTKVQRIRYADNETNYCPRCQTEGRMLADRSLSRLLKADWPRSIDALET